MGELTTCPTCNSPVRVVGGVTKHYEPVTAEIAKWLDEPVEGMTSLQRLEQIRCVLDGVGPASDRYAIAEDVRSIIEWLTPSRPVVEGDRVGALSEANGLLHRLTQREPTEKATGEASEGKD